MMQSQIQEAEAMLKESLALFKELGDKRGIAYALYFIGSMLMTFGQLERARALLEEGLELLNEVGDKWWIGNTLIQLGWTINRQGEHARALTMFNEALDIAQTFGDTRGIARALLYVAEAKLAQSEYDAARQDYLESLQLFQKIGDKWWATVCLENLGVLAARRGHPGHAARLFGASERMHEILNAPMLSPYREHYEPALAQVRAELDEREFSEAWADGRAMTMEQAIELAMSDQ
jgi:tetratricopeptide (TPR) repeat protein